MTTCGPFIEIEISRAGGAFEAAEFETLKAGDRFRVVAPANHYAVGRIYTVRDDAERVVGGTPDNWAVMVDKVEEPPDAHRSIADEEAERRSRVASGLDHPLAPWPKS